MYQEEQETVLTEEYAVFLRIGTIGVERQDVSTAKTNQVAGAEFNNYFHLSNNIILPPH